MIDSLKAGLLTALTSIDAFLSTGINWRFGYRLDLGSSRSPQKQNNQSDDHTRGCEDPDQARYRHAHHVPAHSHHAAAAGRTCSHHSEHAEQGKNDKHDREESQDPDEIAIEHKRSPHLDDAMGVPGFSDVRLARGFRKVHRISTLAPTASSVAKLPLVTARQLPRPI
jgi:hypothetical protein